MWEKIRVVFTIPELRQKILLTLVLAGHLPRRLADPAADRRPEQDDAICEQQQASAAGRALQHGGHVQRHVNLSQSTIFGLGIMPYISASIIFQLLGSVWPPLEATAKGRRKRPQEDQRIHPLRHRRPVPRPKLGLRGLADPA